MHTYHFLHRIRIAENEITKTKIFGNSFAQVDIHFLRVLIDKLSTATKGKLFVADFCRLKNQWNKWITTSNFGKKTNTCMRINFILTRITGIRYDTQRIILVFIV